MMEHLLEPLGAEPETVLPRCNICSHTEFVAFAGREGEKCGECGSLRRHRMAYAVYLREGLFRPAGGVADGRRVLHLAPESNLRQLIKAAVGIGYMPADARPDAYKGECLKLVFPEHFSLFPDKYFDYILHNHVLEHIPGPFRAHLDEFCRMLKPGGRLIFSVPGPTNEPVSREGGEHLASDAERLEQFGQADHLKVFGKDLPQYLASIPGGKFSWDGLSNAERAMISVGPWSTKFLIWRRYG